MKTLRYSVHTNRTCY